MGTRPGAGDPAALVGIAERLEEAGADGVVVSDHVLIGPNVDRYPWGDFPFPPEAPWLEPLTVLTAIAARTTRHQAHDRHPHRAAAPGAAAGQDDRHARPSSPRGASSSAPARGGRPRSSRRRASTRPPRDAMLTDTIAACRVLWRDAPAIVRVADGVVRRRVVRAAADARPAGRRCCSRARSRGATSAASSSWATAGSRSWERPSTTSPPARRCSATRSSQPAATRRRCASGCRCRSCAATSPPPSPAPTPRSPPVPPTSASRGAPSATTASTSWRR